MKELPAIDSNLLIAIVTVVCSVLYTLAVTRLAKVFPTREELTRVEHRLERAEELLRELELAVAGMKGGQP